MHQNMHKCFSCGNLITEDEWITGWGSCHLCWSNHFDDYLEGLYIMRTPEDVERLFSYHQLDSDGITRVHYFRERFKALAKDILNAVPESPERTLVLRELHNSMMKLNVCISLDYPVDPNG